MPLDKDSRMDRDLEHLASSPRFTWRRLWVTLAVSIAIIAGASFLVRTFPNSGHQAGHRAATNKGAAWLTAEVEAAGTALPLCDELFAESEESPSEPRYDYSSFIQGCGEAVDQAYGGHVPMLPPT